MVKLLLYVLVIPLVVWASDSVNFNVFFKKGDVNQYRARIFYMIFILGISINPIIAISLESSMAL